MGPGSFDSSMRVLSPGAWLRCFLSMSARTKQLSADFLSASGIKKPWRESNRRNGIIPQPGKRPMANLNIYFGEREIVAVPTIRKIELRDIREALAKGAKDFYA